MSLDLMSLTFQMFHILRFEISRTGILKNCVLWKTGNQGVVVRVFIAPHTSTANDRLVKRVTNFQYSLHREFGGFTARKLLE